VHDSIHRGLICHQDIPKKKEKEKGIIGRTLDSGFVEKAVRKGRYIRDKTEKHV